MGNPRLALPNLPADIVAALEAEFADLESRFARSDWDPANLNGGRFAEAVFRYLEWKQSGGAYTAIGTPLNRNTVLARVTNDASIAEGLRFQVLKLADVLMDFRNKRDVAHLGNVTNVDEMDARAVMAVASWIMAEIVREESGLPGGEAQDIIDKLSRRRLPLVEEIGGELVVLATDLDAGVRALVALYEESPRPIEVARLREAVGYKNKSRFRDVIGAKQKERLLQEKDGLVYLTRKGAAWIEENVDMELRIR